MLGYARCRLGVSNDRNWDRRRAKEIAEREEKARNHPFAQRRGKNQREKLGDNKSRTILERCNEDLLPATERRENGERAKDT